MICSLLTSRSSRRAVRLATGVAWRYVQSLHTLGRQSFCDGRGAEGHQTRGLGESTTGVERGAEGVTSELVLLGSPEVTGLLELARGSRVPTVKGLAQGVVHGLLDGEALASVVARPTAQRTLLRRRRGIRCAEIR